MKVIEIRAKDVYATLELSATQLRYLKTALDKAELKFDGNIPDEVAAVEYVQERFYPVLKELLREIDDGS